MPRILADSSARYMNPDSPDDMVEVRTVVVAADESMTPAEAFQAVRVAIPEDAMTHKDCTMRGGDALFLAVWSVAH